MNWKLAAGEWKQLKAEMKSKWAKLTDDNLQALEAKKDALVGKIQQRYGVLRDEAERQVDEWIARFPTRPEEQPPREAREERVTPPPGRH